jgi:hypothetical protein
VYKDAPQRPPEIGIQSISNHSFFNSLQNQPNQSPPNPTNNQPQATMRFLSIAATLFFALSSFAAAMPNPEAAVEAAEDGIAFAIEARQCRRIGARCRRDRQCCSGECDDGFCERDDDRDD